MRSQKTQPVNLSQKVNGYFLNSPVSDEFAQKIEDIQNRLREVYGDAIWNVPRNALHITHFDILTPVHDYGQDKDEMFKSMQNDIERELDALFSNVRQIELNFKYVEAFPAAIIIRAELDQELQDLRERVASSIEVPEGTKPIPKIVHVTIARFTREIDFGPIQNTCKDLTFLHHEALSQIRLLSETLLFMQNFKVFRTYHLKS